MKKYFVVLTLVMLLCLTGCGSKEGKIKCTLSSKDAVNDYSLKSTYTINYKGDLVETVDTVEEVTSDKSEVLEVFETQLKETYDKMNKTYGGYKFDVVKKDNKVTSTVNINYGKMKMDQLVKDQPSLKNYVKDNKLKVEGLKAMYKSMGATCE